MRNSEGDSRARFHQVAARLSFDTDGTIAKAHKLISLYEAEGIRRERILIKIASTWEGIRAAERRREKAFTAT